MKTITVLAVIGLAISIGLLWQGSRAEAETQQGAAVATCGTERPAGCSGCPGRTADAQAATGCPGRAADAQAATACPGRAADAQAATACPGRTADAQAATAGGCGQASSGCKAACAHGAEAGCPCGGDRSACDAEMKASCGQRADCDRRCGKGEAGK